MFTELLEMEAQSDLNSDAQEYLVKIKNSTDRMIKLIKTLLHYSQLNSSSITFQPIDLDEIIKDCQTNLELLIKETNAQISTSKLPQVVGSKELIQSLFQNLITNAIKFQKKDNTPQINISAKKMHNNVWEISVSDNGIGFDMQYLQIILKPFGRIYSQHEYPGLGIGLPLCKKIIESHGGSLQIDSQEGKGSRFSFIFQSQDLGNPIS